MIYMLGRRPDEFGLVPDKDGFLTFKEILWALHEEPGWGYVKEVHLREVLMGKDRPLFDWEGLRVRAAERHWRFDSAEAVPEQMPKVLMTGVRRRAHPHVMEKGLSSQEGEVLVLSPERDMALRLAKRRNQDPVILEIMTAQALKEKTVFHRFGDLFLATAVPSSCIAGPPVPEETRELRETLKTARPEKGKPAALPDFKAGSFALDLGRDPDRTRREGRKQRGWKEEARRIRRGKG